MEEEKMEETIFPEKSHEISKSMKRKGIRELFSEEDGMGTVEVILIIVVLVGLVIIFKSQITKVVNSLFEKITSRTDSF